MCPNVLARILEGTYVRQWSTQVSIVCIRAQCNRKLSCYDISLIAYLATTISVVSYPNHNLLPSDIIWFKLYVQEKKSPPKLEILKHQRSTPFVTPMLMLIRLFINECDA